MELLLKCPFCKKNRKFLPRTKMKLPDKRVQCFFCGKYFKVYQGKMFGGSSNGKKTERTY